MGGFGSGWKAAKKATVEDGLTLSMSALIKKGALVPGRTTRGTWCWSWRGEDEPFAQICYAADLIDSDNASLSLSYCVNKLPAASTIRIETTRPHYGGARWWFRCPMTGRRAAKLYLPPGGKLFGCRQAYGLTYRTCQESGQFRRLFASMGAELGMDARDVERALKRSLRD